LKKYCYALFLSIVVFTQISAEKKPDNKQYRAEVFSIADGDTITVLVKGQKLKIRLHGIDTLEVHNNKKAKEQKILLKKKTVTEVMEWGKKAKQMTAGLIPAGTIVYLELDKKKVDKYKRVLAYVFLEDGKMLNELLLQEGLALPYEKTIKSLKYSEILIKAWQKAVFEEKGIWKK